MHDPTIAVLIPAHNEELVIKGTIDALKAAGQDYRDIYIVDDLSTDRTAQIAASCGVNVCRTSRNCGKATAQTVALDHFEIYDRYEWVIFLDGDTEVDIYFINAMFSAAKTNPSVALYVGQVKSAKNDHLYSASRAFDYTYGQEIAKKGQSNFNVIFVSPGCSSMYRTDMLRKLHIDHLTLAEDMDLTMQVHRKGGKVVYLEDAYVNTQDPSTFSDYHKQIMRWYRGFWQVILKHRVFELTKKQGVDLYMIALTLDALVFNRILWFVLLLIISPYIVPAVFAIDLTISFAISLYTAYKTERTDVIWKFPLYYWMSYVNFYAYVRAFVEIVVCRKQILAWNKVKRYEFNQVVTHN